MRRDKHRSPLAISLALATLMSLALIPARAGDSVASEPLDVVTIRKLFESGQNEIWKRSLQNIEWQEGPFTGKSSLDALVFFDDYNQGRASGGQELWLLRFDGGWKISGKLADNHWIFYEAVDIDKDSKLEVWVVSAACNQGICPSEGQLLSLSRGSPSILYSSKSIDKTGFGLDERELGDWRERGEEGYSVVFLGHKVAFLDIDGDGVLEILDEEERARYRWTGEIRPRRNPDYNPQDLKKVSEYVKTSSTSELHLYKMIGGQFQKIEPPSIFSFPKMIKWYCPVDAQCFYVPGVPPYRRKPHIAKQLQERIRTKFPGLFKEKENE